MPVKKRDYYEVLGVARDASSDVIARAYRKLAIQFHPDSNRGDQDAGQKFKEAAEAYEVLSDPEKRARYDRFGHEGVAGAGSYFHSAEDIFEAFSEIFGGGLFGDFFGGRRGQPQRRRGDDIRVDVTLTLEQAARGVTLPVQFTRAELCTTCSGSGGRPGSQPVVCKTCQGRGHVIHSNGILRFQTGCPRCHGQGRVITDPCPDCHGQGYRGKQVELEVAIPAGVDDGMRVRLAGEGQPSPDGGRPGDCYCFVSVERHSLFHRDGSNLILQMPISFSQATLGAEIDVPTLEGPDFLKVPRGSQSGDVFKLAGRGMPDPRTGLRGDLLVQTFIETPKKLSARQEELLRELAELENREVTPQRKSFMERIKNYFSSDRTINDRAAKSSR